MSKTAAVSKQPCKKCQGSTERLMQQASPFYTCMDEKCAFFLAVSTGAQVDSWSVRLRAAKAVAKMESWQWGAKHTPNGNTVAEQERHCFAMGDAVLRSLVYTTDEDIHQALGTTLGLDHTLRQLIRGDTKAVGYSKLDVVRALLKALTGTGARS